MLKIVLAVSLLVAAMVAVKDGRLTAGAGLTGSCSTVTAPVAGDDAAWHACRAGRLEGRPDLGRKSCTSTGVVGDVEYWRCPAGVKRAR